MTTLTTKIQTSPNGTVSLYADRATAELRVFADIDLDPADWTWAMPFMAAASDGHPISCWEPYNPDVNEFIVKLRGDALATVADDFAAV